jgi:hypothetical protein
MRSHRQSACSLLQQAICSRISRRALFRNPSSVDAFSLPKFSLSYPQPSVSVSLYGIQSACLTFLRSCWCFVCSRLAVRLEASGFARPFRTQPMNSVAELQREADDLQRQLRDLKALAKAKRKLERMGESRTRAATPWMRAVAVRVLALSDGDVAAAEAYLLSKGRGEPAAEILRWRDALPAGEAAALLGPAEDRSRSARQLAEARKFAAERGLVSWIARQNRSKGIAPTPGAVLEQASGSGGLKAPTPSRYRWLRRLMRRWGGRKRVLQGCSVLTGEALRRKDLLSDVSFGPRVFCFGLDFRTGKRTCSGHLQLVHLVCGPRVEPSQRPPFGDRQLSELCDRC